VCLFVNLKIAYKQSLFSSDIKNKCTLKFCIPFAEAKIIIAMPIKAASLN